MGKKQLERALQKKQEGNRPLFVPYIMAGGGGLNRLTTPIQQLKKAWAAANELGIPFTHPIADRPTVQEAGIRPLFVSYIMAGDGGLNRLTKRIQLLEKAGAAAIELGIPFTDPVADGPTIQEAGIRALNNGISLKKILNVLEETKQERTI